MKKKFLKMNLKLQIKKEEKILKNKIPLKITIVILMMKVMKIPTDSLMQMILLNTKRVKQNKKKKEKIILKKKRKNITDLLRRNPSLLQKQIRKN